MITCSTNAFFSESQTFLNIALSVSLGLVSFICFLLLVTIISICIFYRLLKRRESLSSKQRSIAQDTPMELNASFNVRPSYHLRQEDNRGYYYIDEIASFPQKTLTSTNPSTRYYDYIDDVDCKIQETSTAVTTSTGPVYEPVGDEQSDYTLKDEQEYLKIM